MIVSEKGAGRAYYGYRKPVDDNGDGRPDRVAKALASDADVLITVADPRRLWLILNVRQEDAKYVELRGTQPSMAYHLAAIPDGSKMRKTITRMPKTIGSMSNSELPYFSSTRVLKSVGSFSRPLSSTRAVKLPRSALVDSTGPLKKPL